MRIEPKQDSVPEPDDTTTWTYGHLYCWRYSYADPQRALFIAVEGDSDDDEVQLYCARQGHYEGNGRSHDRAMMTDVTHEYILQYQQK